ncbi:MAG: response regulator [Archangiaceae bacterium]|nr:response regulator [Archangiaceae bacterium]
MTAAGDDEQVDILLVDDQSAGLLSLEATLEPLGQRLHRAQSGREALRHLLDHDYALILLDVVMPGLDGFETARLIRERERSSQTPIIFLTALSDGALPRLRAYSMGAVDYLVKPFEPEVLRSKVSVFVELARKTSLIEKQARELRDAQAVAHERELARTREEFFAVALHELRTPLTSMGLQMHALKRWVMKATGPLQPTDLQARLGDVEAGMARLNKLSDYLLDISRMREGRVVLERQPVDISEVAGSVVERIQHERRELGVDLEVQHHRPRGGLLGQEPPRAGGHQPGHQRGEVRQRQAGGGDGDRRRGPGHAHRARRRPGHLARRPGPAVSPLLPRAAV